MYRDDSGITFPTTHPFGALLAQTIESYKSRQLAWCDEMQKQGVKAVHPDDGWVNRERNSVHFCYPDFNLRPGVGDLIALGNREKYRLVRVTRIVPWTLKLPGGDSHDYYFETYNA